MSKKTEMTGAERKTQLLEAGAKLASKYGASNVTRRMVAQAAGVSEGLVSLYMGTTADAQKAYTRKAKNLGLKLPSKAEAEAAGILLRKHKPADKRDTRKRSAKELTAVARKRQVKPKAAPARKPAAPAERKPKAAPASKPAAPAERKTAARLPKPPPAQLPLPPVEDSVRTD